MLRFLDSTQTLDMIIMKDIVKKGEDQIIQNVEFNSNAYKDNTDSSKIDAFD